MPAIRLGLIGDNIAASRSPALHRLAGQICGLDVSYDLLVPRVLGLDFEATFDRARADGYRGLNITFPYKERVLPRVTMNEPIVRAIAACNTVSFEPAGAIGANTDYTGFLGAYRGNFGDSAPGNVAMAGCGGVGKAIGFALAALGAKALHLFDPEGTKADELARALAGAHHTLDVQVTGSIEQACESADGFVNCTPLGMVGYDGSAFPNHGFDKGNWAFDAVYTPMDTPFLVGARTAGLSTMGGYELLLYQGIACFRIFTGREIGATELRRALGKFDAGLAQVG